MLKRVPVKQSDVFPDGLLYLGIEPAVNFDAAKDAPAIDRQAKDKESGHLVWNVLCVNPAGGRGEVEVKVAIDAPVQPVSPVGRLQPVEFDGLNMTPYVNGKGRSDTSWRASGFASKPSPVRATASAAA